MNFFIHQVQLLRQEATMQSYVACTSPRLRKTLGALSQAWGPRFSSWVAMGWGLSATRAVWLQLRICVVSAFCVKSVSAAWIEKLSLCQWILLQNMQSIKHSKPGRLNIFCLLEQAFQYRVFLQRFGRHNVYNVGQCQLIKMYHWKFDSTCR